MASEDLLIRPARAEEADMLSDLALRVKSQRGQARGCVEDLLEGECPTDSQILSKYTPVFVLEQADRFVGFYALKLQSKFEIELCALFVEPAYFGKGFWNSLLDHAKAMAVGLGAERLLLARSDPNDVSQYVAAGAAFIGLRESPTTAGQTLAALRLELLSATVA
jgi:N-acetylglutamate synthase-like GNAT family acetyltransferase